jgi:peptide/nickel transport system ATP-binding protein/oligopeptide transport system ATP-binding protein
MQGSENSNANPQSATSNPQLSNPQLQSAIPNPQLPDRQLSDPQSAIRNPQSSDPQSSDPQLLEILDLRVYFHTEDGVLKAVDGVSFAIGPGETLGLVGESGCGKSVTAFSILKLLQSPPAEYVAGRIMLGGEDLLAFSEKRIRRVRGNQVSMVFQEPMSSLNPILSIGAQISEAIRAHRKVSKDQARKIATAMLRRVGIAAPETRFDEYPHQMSGGMKQRAMIAMALVCRPQLLIADEPTTALDVTIQAQILDLLRELQSELGMSVLLITHDLGVVAETCDRVAVMYAGKIVENATIQDLFDKPKHPYTHGLFRSLPTLTKSKGQLAVIPGAVPSPLDFPSGCRFRTRCSMAQEVCTEEPALRDLGRGHLAACHFAEQVGEMQRGSV